MTIALLYSEGEACKIKKIPGGLYILKETFEPDKLTKTMNTEYSEVLETFVTGPVLLVAPIKFSAIYFSDGACYDVFHGEFRQHNEKDYVDKVMAIKNAQGE